MCYSTSHRPIGRRVRVVYRASLLRKWGVKPPEVRILSSPQIPKPKQSLSFVWVLSYFREPRGFEKVASDSGRIVTTYTARVTRESSRLLQFLFKIRYTALAEYGELAEWSRSEQFHFYSDLRTKVRRLSVASSRTGQRRKKSKDAYITLIVLTEKYNWRVG